MQSKCLFLNQRGNPEVVTIFLLIIASVLIRHHVSGRWKVWLAKKLEVSVVGGVLLPVTMC